MTRPKSVKYEDLEIGALAVRIVNEGAPFSVKYVGIKTEEGFFCFNGFTSRENAFPRTEFDRLTLDSNSFYAIGDLSGILYDLEDSVLHKLGFK